MKRSILLLAVLSLFSCKKDEAIPNGVKAKQEVVYTYKMTLNVARTKPTMAINDTLIIKVNGTTVYNKSNGNVSEFINNIYISTGDKLYIRYNPGMVKYPHYDPSINDWSDYVYEGYCLNATFEGGYYKQDFTDCGPGITVIDKLISESRP